MHIIIPGGGGLGPTSLLRLALVLVLLPGRSLLVHLLQAVLPGVFLHATFMAFVSYA